MLHTQRTEVCNKSFVVLQPKCLSLYLFVSVRVYVLVCVCVYVRVLLSDFLWNAFEMHLTNGQMRRGQKRKPCAQLKPLYSHAVAALLVVLVGVVVIVALECVPERPSDLSSPHRT